MIGASKILTVSYGTFSCTLEGFDDPFNTMRAIAEYFRDLAAEDRYFGAEPPTPDAAMLHKIAEREIQRRVEAKIQDNGVILRAGEIDSPLSQTVARGPGPAMTVVERPTPQLAAPIEGSEQAGDDSVVARLARLRDVSPPDADRIEASFAEDQHADTDPLFEGDPLDDAQVESRTEDTIASVLADLSDRMDDVADILPSAEDTAIPALSDVAEWVEDAPAVVTVDDARTDALSEAEGTPAVVDAADPDAAILASLGSMIDPEGEDDEEEDNPVAASNADTAFQQAAPDPDTAVSEVVSPVAAETVVVPQEIPAAPVAAVLPEKLERARARVIKIRRIEAASAKLATPENAVVVPPAAAATEARPSVLSPEAEAELQRELAALEIEAAPKADKSVADAPSAMDTAEETLQRALADVEIETATLPAAVMDAAPVSNVAPDVLEEETRKPTPATPADDAVNRLLSQTNTAMEGTENKRRLAAIAHLKAAVAATFADRKANPGVKPADPEQRMDAYREDLDRVVRPRRPALVSSQGDEATLRPDTPTERPAPLVLVSEQRIDRPVAAVAQIVPVRPRRITAESEAAQPAPSVTTEDDDLLDADEVGNIFAEPGRVSFDEFAARLGAKAMPDLIEAAAAYCTMVLGRRQFSRPLLMQQIESLPDASRFGREECLRGFGTLMRNGRIAKIRRGQFKLSDHSHYLSEAKRLAG